MYLRVGRNTPKKGRDRGNLQTASGACPNHSVILCHLSLLEGTFPHNPGKMSAHLSCVCETYVRTFRILRCQQTPTISRSFCPPKKTLWFFMLLIFPIRWTIYSNTEKINTRKTTSPEAQLPFFPAVVAMPNIVLAIGVGTATFGARPSLLSCRMNHRLKKPK